MPGADVLDALGAVLLARGYRFTTVSPATHARVNARPGNAEASSLEGVFGWGRPAPPGLLPVDVFDAGRAAGVLVPQGAGWRSTVRASSLAGRLFFHSAYPTDRPDAVFFGHQTSRATPTCSRPSTASST